MCGIFGIILKPKTSIESNSIYKLLNNLYTFSESRGKESSGLHCYLPINGQSWTIKSNESASTFLQSKGFKKTAKEIFDIAYRNSEKEVVEPMVLLGHSRLVTNGCASINLNNQPVQAGQITIIHNGIIVNVDELWLKHSDLKRTAQVDTEIMAAMLDSQLKQDFDYMDATVNVYKQIKGAASIAWLHSQSETIVLATNTGDLYYSFLPQEQGIIFASEKYILEQSIKKAMPDLSEETLCDSIQGLQAGKALAYNTKLKNKSVLFDCFTKETESEIPSSNSDFNEQLSRQPKSQLVLSEDHSKKESVFPNINTSSYDYSLIKYNEAALREIKRCAKCILPESFPFIQFNNKGICNYCENYRPRYANMHHKDTKLEFIASLKKYKSNKNLPDTLVPFSGGRDSSYGLHLICKEFDLKPITFTYDWGMVTDLARRNIARMCGQLGVQNILISADINTKRKNIRNNIIAWLKKPELGMVPLFMAGDKAFFKIVNQLKRQTGIALDLWCANPLENTDFKSGFCGISPDFDKSRLDYLSLSRKIKMAQYYLKQFILNPRYINTSLFDTFKAFLSYYFEPRKDFFFIFDHFIWNEEEVNETLLNEYDWETSPDSSSTWRIGDGTAPFYNYIYNMANGFSEFDTFRSNQIREGALKREDALELVLVENRPRQESLRWYLDTIGLDFNDVIKRINQLDKRKLHQ